MRKSFLVLLMSILIIGCANNNQSFSNSEIDYEKYDFDWQYDEYEITSSLRSIKPIADYNEQDWEELYKSYSGVTKDDNFVYCHSGGNTDYSILRCLSQEKQVVIPETYGKNFITSEPCKIINILMPAFVQCPNLETLVISKNIRSINRSLSECSSLKEIYVAEGNENIRFENHALYSLQDNEKVLLFVLPSSNNVLTIDDDVYGIEVDAFNKATNITELTLGAHFHERISYFPNMLNYMIDLESISVSENNEKYSAVDGVLINKEKTTLVKYPCGKKGDYHVPKTINSIANYAFNNCHSLKKLLIDGDIEFNDATFIGAKSLENIEITNNSAYISINGDVYTKDLKTLYFSPIGKKEVCINEGTLKVQSINSASITFLSIPDSVKSIDEYAITCPNLKEVVLGKDIEIIGDYAFGYDYTKISIEKVFFRGSVTKLEEANKGLKNKIIAKAQRYYYSENKPTKNEHHFWHYVDNKPTVW